MEEKDIKNKVKDKYGGDATRVVVKDDGNLKLDMRDGNVLTITKGSLDDLPDLNKKDEEEEEEES